MIEENQEETNHGDDAIHDQEDVEDDEERDY